MLRGDHTRKTIGELRQYIKERMASSPKDLEFFSGVLSLCDEFNQRLDYLEKDSGVSEAFIDPNEGGAHKIG